MEYLSDEIALKIFASYILKDIGKVSELKNYLPDKGRQVSISSFPY